MAYVRQRLIQLVIVILAVTMLTFTFLRLLPGDPAISIAGIGATESQLAEVRHKWGLDQPLPVQYIKWLGKMFTGNLGISSAYNVKVTTLVSQRLPVTLYLMFYAMLISLVIAIPLGIWTAYRANRPADRIVSTISFGLLSIPPYILGVRVRVRVRTALRLVPGALRVQVPVERPRRGTSTPCSYPP